MKSALYENQRTREMTDHAAIAMAWHRAGDDITITGYTNGKLKCKLIHGAKQPKRNADDENRAHCKHIARELEAYADGQVYRCPECGEIHRMPDAVGDKYRCPDCGTVNPVEDYEQLSVYDFLSDLYDIELRVGMDGEYRSCKIMVAFGGPNIYIDTADAMVKLYWWTERAEYPLSYDARDAVDEFVEEWRDCR